MADKISLQADGARPGCGTGTLLTLEALRGAAAMLVVVRHAPDVFGLEFPSLHLAVDMFFMLSGFVIAYAYEPRLASGMSRWRFLRLRLIRLYPLYVLGLVISAAGIVLAKRAGDLSWSDARLALSPLLNVLFLPGPGRAGETFVLNLAAWSLFFELVANLVYVLTWRWLSVRTLVAVVGLAALGLIFSERVYGSLGVGWNWATFPGGFARVFYGFAVGVLLYRLWGATHRLPLSPWLPVGILCAALLMGGGRQQGLYELAVVLLLFPAVLVLGVSLQPAGQRARLFRFLGLISYGLYVLHVPVLELARRLDAFVPAIAIERLAPWGGLLFFGAMLPAVWLIDRLYDGPLRARLGGPTGGRLRQPEPRAGALQAS